MARMRLALAGLLASALAGTAAAQQPLFESDSRIGHLAISPDIFSMQAGERAVLPPLGGAIHETVLTRIETGQAGGQAWFGQVRGPGPGYSVVITHGNGATFGTVITPEGSWSLAPDPVTGSLAFSPMGSPPEEPDTDVLTLSRNQLEAIRTSLTPPTARSASQQSVPVGSNGTIDIAVVYTAGMEAWYGTGVITRVQHLVNVLDQAMIDSDTGLRARLVLALPMPVPWVETTSTLESIDDLVAGASFGNAGTSADVFGTCSNSFGLQCNNDGDLSSLLAIRDGVAADIVVMVRRYWRAQQTYCGVAYLPGGGEGVIDPAEDHVLGVGVVGDGPDGNGTGANCGDLTFAHEVGHNLGSTHNIENAGGPGVFDFSYGHRYDCSLRTIMAYDSLRSNLTCLTNSPPSRPNETWIAAFSNPEVNNCLGLPCGSGPGGWNIPGSNSDNTTALTDNARSMRDQGYQVRFYRHPEAAPVRSAILPYSRTVPAGQTATAFVTIANPAASGGTATGCGLILHGANENAFSFQTTDPATNAVTGSANTPADIPAGGTQSFVISVNLAPSTFPSDLRIDARCTNRRTAPVITGVNTFRYLATSQSLPDMVALAATPSANGILELPSATGAAAFSVASINLATAAEITVTPELGTGTPAVGALEICRTDPGSGSCQTPRAASVTLTAGANESLTFGVFVRAAGVIANDPAANRVFVNFRNAGNLPVGGTSVAVRTAN